MKILKTVLLLFLASTAAQASPSMLNDSFVDAKTGYVVEVSHIGSRMILNGRHPQTAKTFRLVVASSSGRVTGIWEGRPVDYRLSSPVAVKELAAYRSGR